MQLSVLQKENYYGHRKRLLWLKDKINGSDKILEVGCGCGTMITIPLLLSLYNVYGIDISDDNIQEAKKISVQYGVDAERFQCIDVADVKEEFDVVILSEVLEHIPSEWIDNFINDVCARVKKKGKLILTVPNGTGTYERGQKYWKKRVEKFERFLSKISSWIRSIGCKNANSGIKSVVVGGGEMEKMDLTNSPHVQFFKYKEVVNIFQSRGFILKSFTGSAMFSGVIINTFFVPAIPTLCRINNWLGDLFPKLGSGWYFEFVKAGN